MSVKKIKVGGVEHLIDYNALENLPVVPPCPKKVNIINYVVDGSKDDGRPAGEEAYAEGKIDSVEIFRYACPERIDIDDKPETHKDYVKDGRQIYARDGDFGYPEIDGTGQFNFRPNFNVPGYVLIPEGITPADGYNNFKTQWNIGIPGMYRLTKIHEDLTIDLHAVEESTIPAHTITYKVIAPVDYEAEYLPEIRIFRGADHCEKFMKYGPGATNPAAHPALDESLISGNLLVLGEPTVEEIEGVNYNVWTVLDKAYDDANGLPSADTTGDVAKVYFNIGGTPKEGYAYTVDAVKVGTNFNKMNPPTDSKKYYTLTKVAGDIEVDIKAIVDLPDVTLTFVNNSEYGIEDANKAAITAPITINGLVDFKFKITHNLKDANKKHAPAITSVVIGETTYTGEDINTVLTYAVSKNKDEIIFKKAYITDNITITVDPTSVPQDESAEDHAGE